MCDSFEGQGIMQKEERERKIFAEFAQVAPFKVLPGTIESRVWPEPDILCKIENYGQVGFELTELVDQEYMARIDLLFKTKKYLNRYWQNELHVDDSALFGDIYSGALLHFEFSQLSNFRERKKAAKKAFSKLLNLNKNAQGEFLKDDSALAPVLQYVQIDRIGLNELTIDVNSYVHLGDPTARAIKKKFSKKYVSDYPIELLAHINCGIMPSEEIWKDSAEKTATQISDSPFRKIWIFDSTDKKIKYEFER